VSNPHGEEAHSAVSNYEAVCPKTYGKTSRPLAGAGSVSLQRADALGERAAALASVAVTGRTVRRAIGGLYGFSGQ
jgi:hypothetical protein